MNTNFSKEDIRSIKNIIFDFGGVLLNIDYNRTVEGFRSLGMENPEQAFTRETQAKIFKEYEVGAVTSEGFIKELQNHLPLTKENGHVNSAWCALLGDLPKQRFEMLDRLKDKFRLFLLSNTNEIHQLQFEAMLDEVYGKNEFLNKFEKAYYSHNLKMRKPNAEIFQWVLQENNLNPEETLFIDDTAEHVEAAERLGLHTHWLREGEEITEVLSSFLQ